MAKARSVAKKSVAVKKSAKKGTRGYSTYINRVLKGASKAKLTLSGKSMKILNSFVADMFEQIAVEAAALARSNKKRTLGSREIQTAVRVLDFPSRGRPV